MDSSITLITPTGDRPEAFSLCEYWMSRQTIQPGQWIVVDDGSVPTCTTRGQEYVRRQPESGHTLSSNLLAALPLVRSEKVLIIEDDDYYSPTYVEVMSRWLDDAELVGERGAKYYFLRDKAWYYWSDHEHASLCRTGLRRSVLPVLSQVIDGLGRGDWRVDLHLWDQFRGTKKLAESSASGRAMCVGVKQMPGRAGVTHQRYDKSVADLEGRKLREWLPEDWKPYRRFIRQRVEGLATYTCLFGGYDRLPQAPGPECYVVSDSPSVPEGWKRIDTSRSFTSPKQASRYYKMNSHCLFPDRPTLYVDANVTFKKTPSQIASHLSHQNPVASVVLFRHRKSRSIRQEIEEVVRLKLGDRSEVDTELTRRYDHLPVGWGGCLLRKPGHDTRALNEEWWRLFDTGKYPRDQVVLPIALQTSFATHQLVDEPLPFHGETSEWMGVRRHLLRRSRH